RWRVPGRDLNRAGVFPPRSPTPPCAILDCQRLREPTPQRERCETAGPRAARPCQVMISTDFGDLIAERMRVEHRALAARWFDRLLDLLPVDAREVFPTESLLDHVPTLILE